MATQPRRKTRTTKTTGAKKEKTEAKRIVVEAAPGKGAPPRRDAFLVLGMHRSGTSALSGILAKLGGKTPRDLMPANADNPSGYWESVSLMRFNDKLLRSAGSNWSDWDVFNPDWASSAEAAVFSNALPGLVREEFGDAPLILIKDPRISRFAKIWIDGLQEAGFHTGVVMPVRHPLEVAQSLQRRDGFGIARGQLLWLRHVLEAEFASRNVPRCFVRYTSLLEDWQSQVRRISVETGIALPRRSNSSRVEVDQFLSSSLRHNRIDQESRAVMDGWAAEAFQLLGALADGRAFDQEIQEALDRLRNVLDTTGALYGAAVREQELASQARVDASERIRSEAESKAAASLVELDSKKEFERNRTLDEYQNSVKKLEDRVAELEAMTTALRSQRDEALAISTRSQASLNQQSVESALASQWLLSAEDRASKYELELKETAERAALAEQRTASAEQRFEASQQRVAVAEQRAEVAEQRAEVAEQRADTAEQRADTAQQRADTAEQQARMSEQRAEVAEQRAKDSDERANVAGQQATEAEQQSKVAEQQSKVAEQQSKVAAARAAAAEHRATLAAQRAEDAEQKATSSEQRAKLAEQHAVTSASAKQSSDGQLTQLRTELEAVRRALEKSENVARQRSEAMASLQRAFDSRQAEGAQAQLRIQEIHEERLAELEAQLLSASTATETVQATLRQVEATSATKLSAMGQKLADAERRLLQIGNDSARERSELSKAREQDAATHQRDRRQLVERHSAELAALRMVEQRRQVAAERMSAALRRLADQQASDLREISGKLAAIHGSRLWRYASRLRQEGTPESAAPTVEAQALLLRQSGRFDAAWYLMANPDVVEQGVDPVLHYLEFGASEGRNPRPDFDTLDYLSRHPDASQSGLNPLVHELIHLAPAGGKAKE